MEIAKLVLQYLQALAWPLVVVVLMILLRTELRGLAGRLTGAKVPGAEFSFAETQAQAARVEAEDSRAELANSDGQESLRDIYRIENLPEQRLNTTIADLADTLISLNRPSSKRSSILDAWDELEEDLQIFYKNWELPLRAGSKLKLLNLPDSWQEAYDRAQILVGILERDESQVSPAARKDLAQTIQDLSRQFHFAHLRLGPPPK